MRPLGLPRWLSALLIVAVVAPGSLAVGHSHQPGHEGGHGAEPAVYAAGHNSPDHTVHVEAATGIEAPACQACSLRTRERGIELVATALERPSPGAGSSTELVEARPSAGFRYSFDARGPPLA